MPVTRCFPLNPCDTLFFAHHSIMQRSGQGGNLPFMIMEVEGQIEPGRLDQAVNRAIDAHPTLRSRARLSIITQRPYWRSANGDNRPASVHHDLRAREDWLDEADRLCQEYFAAGWDVFCSPQVRIEHYQGVQGARLCLRWPHPLMDAEGAQWFMHEVDRLDRAPDSQPPAALRMDDAPVDPLADAGLWQRIKLFRRGVRGYQPFGRVAVGGLAAGAAEGGRWRFMHRCWSGAAYDEVRRRADQRCPSGPARFSRYLGACVLRALHGLYRESGLDTDAYLVTLPMKVRGLPAERPLPGNFLVSTTLCARREVVEDKERLLGELAEQVTDFVAREGDRSSWAMIWMMGWLRQWQYRRILAWSTVHQPYTSGLSHYGEIDPPLRSFLGARVLNFWGCSNTSAPPGWNPAFSRFGDTLNLSLAWLEGYYRRETVSRYLDLIEAELFERAAT